MDEEIKLNEYQKIIVKAAAANTLMSKLRDVARCINETKNMFGLCDPDFGSSEISKKMIHTDDKIFELAQEMSLIYMRIVNSETFADRGEINNVLA